MGALLRTGILLTAFGGPDSIESVGPFMAGFMGREPSSEVVRGAEEKYRAIGGRSPLPDTAAAIGQLLERRLCAHGRDAIVRVGMRYSAPSIGSAIEEIVDAGATKVVMVSLSAFDSSVTAEAYRRAAIGAAKELGADEPVEAPMLHEAPQYRAYFGRQLARALANPGAGRPLVVMTAHSLPVADVREGEPYVAGLRAVAAAVAHEAGLAPGEDLSDDTRLPGVEAFGSLDGTVPWLMAYQSRGVRPGEWLGPDLDRVMSLAREVGYDGVVVVPIGFAIDHMETLWDLDIQAAEHARALGIAFLRTPVPNDDDAFIDTLVWAVEPLL